jgi:hypothetical protein
LHGDAVTLPLQAGALQLFSETEQCAGQASQAASATAGGYDMDMQKVPEPAVGPLAMESVPQQRTSDQQHGQQQARVQQVTQRQHLAEHDEHQSEAAPPPASTAVAGGGGDQQQPLSLVPPGPLVGVLVPVPAAASAATGGRSRRTRAASGTADSAERYRHLDYCPETGAFSMPETGAAADPLPALLQVGCCVIPLCTHLKCPRTVAIAGQWMYTKT